MLEKSWPEISKDLGKELEVFSASDMPDSVKISHISPRPKPFFIESLLLFRYVCGIIRFHGFKILGSYP